MFSSPIYCKYNFFIYKQMYHLSTEQQEVYTINNYSKNNINLRNQEHAHVLHVHIIILPLYKWINYKWCTTFIKKNKWKQWIHLFLHVFSSFFCYIFNLYQFHTSLQRVLNCNSYTSLYLILCEQFSFPKRMNLPFVLFI